MAITTLQTLTDSLRARLESHAQINCVHFGNISDVNSPKNMVNITYPYAFCILNPSTSDRRQMKISIDLIMMNTCFDVELDILKCYSDMLEIVKDIVASYILTDADSGPLSLSDSFTFTPFVERFKDTVAGVTANLTFTIDTPISRCYFPVRS